VRALTGDRERTYDRKVLEMARAVALDRHLGKEAVLQMYLDAPYLGQDGNLSVCGFEAASRYYYNIPAAELSLSQAALLVGILPAPGRYAPDRNPEQARQRRDLVLRRMGDLGWEVESALREPVRVSPTPLLTERFPAYLSAVRVEMESRVAPELLHGAGLDIHTALDPGVQARSESLLRHRAEHMLPGASARAGQSLLIVGAMVDPRDGHLVAAIDPAMADSHGFNRVTQTRRQAGSSYKTVVYAMAMQPGKGGAPRFQPHDSVPNLPRRFGGDKVGWSPRNHGDSYTWRATLGFGLIASQNLATAELLEKLGGAGPLIDFAAQVGFDTSGYRPEMGLGLGQAEVTPVEMARFYASIANGGLLVSGQPVIKAVDADGTVIYEAAPPSARILSEQSTALLRSLLVQVVETSTGRKVRGTSSHAGYKGPVFGKTGTTNDERDLWFVGATPEYSAALWMGFDQLASLGGTAGELAAPTWGAWLNEAYGERSPGEWAGPRLSEQAVCRETGRLPGEFCSVVRLPFAPGQKPLPQCASTHEPIVLDTEGEEAGILGFQPGGPMGAAYPVPQ
jgi:membrane peptidoglycan carboxypeptidase